MDEFDILFIVLGLCGLLWIGYQIVWYYSLPKEVYEKDVNGKLVKIRVR